MYLLIKLYVSNTYNKIFDYFFKVREIHVVENNIKKSIMTKYIFYCFFNYLISYLLKLRKVFDIKKDIVQIIKKNKNNNQICIISKNNINFDQINEQLDSITDTQNNGSVIYRKFHIYDDNNDICFKDYLIKYKDHYKLFDNTVENILLFNNIYITGNPIVNITFWKNSETIHVSVLYEDIKNLHISDLDHINSNNDILYMT
jgi:hypothetical protein